MNQCIKFDMHRFLLKDKLALNIQTFSTSTEGTYHHQLGMCPIPDVLLMGENIFF